MLAVLSGCSSSMDEPPPAAEEIVTKKAILATSAGEMPIVVQMKDGRAIFEGDIELPLDAEGNVRTQSFGNSNATRRFSLGALWPRGIVYYRYDATVGTALKATIVKAINHYHQRTPLVFVEDTNQVEGAFVLFQSPAGSSSCHSGIGYAGTGKVVTTELGNGCNSFDTVVHEMGHAIGLRHEHTRPDRDDYLTINFSNLRPGMASNFDKWTVREGLLTDYDYDSVMHYNSSVVDPAFVFDTSIPVFTRKDGSLINAQDGSGLSDGDVRGIQEMYGDELEPIASTVAWGPNRLDTFVRGTDGSLFHKAWNGSSWIPSASGYESLGGYLVGSAEVVSWGAGRLDVFVRGSDRSLFHKVLNGSTWWPSVKGYESLGGTLAAHPSAVSWGANRLDVFGKGDDGQVIHKWWNGASWSGWESLGGYSIGPVKAVSWGANRIDLFTVGTDKALFHKAWNGSSWSPSQGGWERLGGAVYGEPSIATWSANRIDIIVKGQDGSVFRKAWNGSAWWPSQDGYESLGGGVLGSPQVVAWGPNRLDVVAQGLGGQLVHKWMNGTSWSGWESLGGEIIGSPSIVSWGPNRLDLFVRGMNDGLFHKSWNGSSWYPSATGSWEPLSGIIAW